jgi:hypothetical protein
MASGFFKFSGLAPWYGSPSIAPALAATLGHPGRARSAPTSPTHACPSPGRADRLLLGEGRSFGVPPVRGAPVGLQNANSASSRVPLVLMDEPAEDVPATDLSTGASFGSR